VAIVNGYCTLTEVKSALRIAPSDTQDDALLEKAIEGASRRIDGYCQRFFYQRSATVTLQTRFEKYVAIPELASSTLTLRTDDNGDGVFETLWTTADYLLEPTDTAVTLVPFRRIVAVGSKTFPILTDPVRASIQLQGTFGWSYVPDDIREACVLLSMRGFARYNSALGVVGFADMAIQVRAVDPDVRDLLSAYKLLVVT
jgi:hypothetical protein